MTDDDFPLPSLGPILTQVKDMVQNGRGFALIKGLPVDTWSQFRP